MNKPEIRKANERAEPQPWLRPWVSAAIGRRVDQLPATYRIFPNMSCEIFFNFGDHEVSTALAQPLKPLGRATVFGPKTGCNQHRVGAKTDWFMVQLTALGARALLDCPLAALTNAMCDLNEVLPHSDGLIDRIEASRDFPARLLAFEQWAEAKLSRSLASHRISALSALHRQMKAFPGRTIGTFANQLDLGDRQFRTVFRDEIGLAPKELTGLLRIEHGWTALYQTGSIGDASGLFADHAHFTREFQRFTQITPSEYKRLKLSGDTIMNGFDEGIAASLSIA